MQAPKWDALWINALVATCDDHDTLIEKAAIAVQGDQVVWLGAMQDLPGDPAELAAKVLDVTGYCITPGLIDCHTHVVYAGHRANEFAAYLQGATYEDIARRGGGIQATVTATRAASEDELYEQSLVRVKNLLASGVTTLEIKSGYGLDWATELKILRVAQRIAETLDVTVSKTFLGAHTLPPEFHGHATDYVDLICQEMIPRIANEKLAEAVDVFCEKIAFTLAETERVFASAKHHQLAVKCHAEQLSYSGSAELAAKYQALSVDHLEFLSAEGVKAIAQSGTVAVLLPGAFYFLRESKLPPLQLLREHRVPIAIASDCNPGTSPVVSLLIVMNMACVLFRLTPYEALLGVTRHAAKALGLEKSHGSLQFGKKADFVIWDVQHPDELAYYVGHQPIVNVVKNGKIRGR